MAACAFALPPTLEYHIVKGNAPSEYYIFWPIIGVSCLITAIVIFPQLVKMRNAAVIVRDKQGDLMIPSTYAIVNSITAFPLFVNLGLTFIIIAPVTALLFDLVIAMGSAVVLLAFAQLVVMYLGSYNSAHEAWEKVAPKTKFYGVPPFCCLSVCVKPKNMTKEDFRIVYRLIKQYMVIGPIISAINLFPAWQV